MNFMLRTSLSSTPGGPPILFQGLWQMLQNNSAICDGPAKVIIIVIPPRPFPPPSPCRSQSMMAAVVIGMQGLTQRPITIYGCHKQRAKMSRSLEASAMMIIVCNWNTLCSPRVHRQDSMSTCMHYTALHCTAYTSSKHTSSSVLRRYKGTCSSHRHSLEAAQIEMLVNTRKHLSSKGTEAGEA